MIAPNSTIRLCSGVRLDADYENTRMFVSASDQASYFNSKAFKELTEFTYIRESSIVKVQEPIDTIYLCNYVMYRNINHSTKWFYAFVTKIEYVNDKVSALHLKSDLLQTWMFESTWLPSFIEREHCQEFISTTPLLPKINTVDEGLDYGDDYHIVNESRFYPHGNIYFLLLASTVSLTTAADNPNRYASTVVNGLTNPLHYYLLPITDDHNEYWSCNGETLSTTFITMYQLRTNEQYVNAIVSMSILPMCPFAITINETTRTITSSSIVVDDDANIAIMRLTGDSAERMVASEGLYAHFPTYECSKMYMYPYSFIQMTDYQGNILNVKMEYVEDEDLTVNAKVGISASPKIAYIPQLYHGSESLHNAIISTQVTDIPIVNNETAAYMQSQRNSERQAIMSGLVMGVLGGAAQGFMYGGGAGAAGGAIGGAVTGLFSQGTTIAKMMAKKKDIANAPDNLSKQGGNVYFDLCYDYTGVFLIRKTVKPEYAKKLQDYWKRYGYKVNEIKLPNLKTRTKFNYVKTIGANIVGGIPQEDLMELREIFDKGITLWHVEITQELSGNTEVTT